ncbi:MAG: hypothetical protein JWM21_28 [Acidobacteria bacterium]|nr:hypothetical protein [Acidobacteriota bacterium]
MSQLWAMQRANGDWFALDDKGAFRVPVFQSSRDAAQARAFNVEMLVFHPVTVDETVLKDLGRANGSSPSHFWLVDQEAVNLKRGHRIDHAQLVILARGSGKGNGNG